MKFLVSEAYIAEKKIWARGSSNSYTLRPKQYWETETSKEVLSKFYQAEKGLYPNNIILQR